MEEIRAKSITRDQIDTEQYPDFWEFELIPDVETRVKPKEGFVLELPELRIGAYWRFVPDGEELVLEKLVGSTWVEQTRYTA